MAAHEMNFYDPITPMIDEYLENSLFVTIEHMTPDEIRELSRKIALLLEDYAAGFEAEGV